MKGRLLNFGVLFVTLLLIFLADRVLLSRLGLPLWTADPVLHYKHRPGTIRNWGPTYDHKPIRINRYGHHDDDFSQDKPFGELRGIIIGNSIVMGHGVTAHETFANQLEAMLRDSVPGYASYQVINAGVQGYSTFQYLEILKRSLPFSPDFIVVGFCMNDITEPYIANTAYGGSGLDYHGILQSPKSWMAYVANETGFGRLAIRLRQRIERSRPSMERLARAETYSVYRMAQRSETDSVFIAAWARALSDLSRIYQLAESREIPLVLIIFPFVLQLDEESLQPPQRILKRHAEEQGVGYIDMTEIAEQLRANGVALEDIFLDKDHYTPKGHGIVAQSLLRYLRSHAIIRPAAR
jgi:lysophospholipase L1-like esterase